MTASHVTLAWAYLFKLSIQVGFGPCLVRWRVTYHPIIIGDCPVITNTRPLRVTRKAGVGFWKVHNQLLVWLVESAALCPSWSLDFMTSFQELNIQSLPRKVGEIGWFRTMCAKRRTNEGLPASHAYRPLRFWTSETDWARWCRQGLFSPSEEYEKPFRNENSLQDRNDCKKQGSVELIWVTVFKVQSKRVN